jgi:hypothetical protein
MRRKAAAGQVTGGRVFDYDNLEVCDAAGSPAGCHFELEVVDVIHAAAGRRGFARALGNGVGDATPSRRIGRGFTVCRHCETI